MSRQGMVYLVGAGPGDPGLITLRGKEILERAEVVLYDSLVSPRLLDFCRPSARLVFVGKRRGHHEVPQDEINRLLVAEAQAGNLVVRLKGGDPFVFGRGAEEAETLYHAGVPFRVVPGVTAGVGALAYAGFPVTHRDYASGVLFITGHDDPDQPGCRADWPHLAQFDGSIVIYMGVVRLMRIAQLLIAHGKSPETPVGLVRKGSWPDQQVVVSTLAEVADPNNLPKIKPPALILIGDVVKARPALDWWSRLPLAGQSVLVTRPESDADSTVNLLEELGARVLTAPAITIRPIDDPGLLDEALKNLARFDWLVFTSANGVRYLIDRIFQTGRDLRVLSHLKLAAIGPGTARALQDRGFIADLVPEKFRSEDLAEALRPHVPGKRVLLARADRGRTVLKDELDSIASEVIQVPVYHNADAETLPADILNELNAGHVDWVMLTSSAIARRFVAMLPADFSPELLSRIKFASISPVTSAAAREVGITPIVEAKEFTIAGLVEAMRTFAEVAHDHLV